MHKHKIIKTILICAAMLLMTGVLRKEYFILRFNKTIENHPMYIQSDKGIWYCYHGNGDLKKITCSDDVTNGEIVFFNGQAKCIGMYMDESGEYEIVEIDLETHSRTTIISSLEIRNRQWEASTIHSYQYRPGTHDISFIYEDSLYVVEDKVVKKIKDIYGDNDLVLDYISPGWSAYCWLDHENICCYGYETEHEKILIYNVLDNSLKDTIDSSSAGLYKSYDDKIVFEKVEREEHFMVYIVFCGVYEATISGEKSRRLLKLYRGDILLNLDAGRMMVCREEVDGTYRFAVKDKVMGNWWTVDTVSNSDLEFQKIVWEY